jgi:hypothetical protein
MTDAAADYARMNALYDAWGVAARVLESMSGGGAMNLTPDHVKATPEWQAAFRAAEVSRKAYVLCISIFGSRRVRAAQLYGKQLRAEARAAKTAA